jgi:elongation factor G
MKLEASTPEEYLGSVVGNLQQRRARVSDMRARGNLQIISATVPLGEMFGYATDLRSQSQGRASYSMEFSHYSPAPNFIIEKVMGKK